MYIKIMTFHYASKIWQCLVTLPKKSLIHYWGAPDIKDYIPENCFIDLNDFENIEECVAYCNNLNSEEKEIYRIEIDRFLKSDNFKKFKNGIHGFVSDFYLADHNQR